MRADESADSGLSSMAAYLGREVTLSSREACVENGDGGKVRFDLSQKASKLRVELLDSRDTVAATKEFGEMEAGKHTVALDNLDAGSGRYTIKVTAAGEDGASFDAEGYAAGTVSGFVPGPDPVLIVNNQEVSPRDVREVGESAPE